MEMRERSVPGRRAGRGARSFALAAAVAVAAAALPAPALAQERSDDCRCVDRDGKEIENCVCLRSRNFDAPVLARLVGPARARIGVSVSSEQGSDRDSRGVRVQSVVPDGPADEAGLREGDLIVRVDGRSVFDALEDREAEADLDLDRSVPVQRFLVLMRGLDDGDEVEIEYLRDGERRTAVVTAEEGVGWGLSAWTLRGDGPVAAFAPRLRGSVELDALRGGDRRSFVFRGPGESAVVGWSDPCVSGTAGRVTMFGMDCVGGVELRQLGPELGEYFSTDRGVLVVAVDDESSLGLRAGDVIVSIDGREVDEPRDVTRIVRSYDDDEDIPFRIVRKGSTMEVTGRRR